MHAALLDRTISALGAVRRHIVFSAALRSLIGEPIAECTSSDKKCPDLAKLVREAPDVTNWRILDHCTAVNRTYALFEGFVFQILREYIGFLAKSYKLSELGNDFVAKYTRGIGQILVDQDKLRYARIDIPSLLAGANVALSDQHPYQIQPESLIRAEQNLRMPEVTRLFRHCGIQNADRWTSGHRAVKSFFAAQSRLSETAESELRQIVDYRNEAAHGEVDQVLGTEVLVELTEFFEALSTSISDLVQYDTIRRSKDLGQAKVVGLISECFRDDVVVANIVSSSLSEGDELYIFGKGVTGKAEVKSIQLDGVPQTSVDIKEEREVGLRLGIPAKVGCELIRLDGPV